MADKLGPPVPHVDEALAVEPYRYDFLQALRLLERRHRGLPRFGRAKRAAQEPIRAGQEPYLAFPPATISSFQPGTGDRPARLWVRFFGLFGPHGPLPTHLTTYARQRLDQERDPTFSRFADVFHHRLLLLFYRAWADSQPAVDYDRPDETRFSGYVGSLAGSGTDESRAERRWMHHAELFHIGYFASGTRHASGLKHMLEDVFEIPVGIEPFVGGWLRLPKNTLCHLGVRGTLGVDAIAGEYSFQRQHRFRIMLGPLDFEAFERFLPGGRSLRRLASIVRRAVGDALEWDLKIVLKRTEVPKTSLEGTAKLGLTSWCGKEDRRTDAEDLVLHVDRLRSMDRVHGHA